MTRVPRRRALAGVGALAASLAGCGGRADTPPAAPALPAEGGTEMGVAYRETDAGTLRADLYHPGGEVPVVVHVPGDGWSGQRMRRPLFDRLLGADYAVVDVGYRPAGEVTFPAPVRDLLASLKWIRANSPALRVNPTRLAVVGAGTGGHLAALGGAASAHPPFQPRNYLADVAAAVGGVGSIAGTYDLTRSCDDPRPAVRSFLGGTCPEARERYRAASPATHVDGLDPAVWLAHGTDDATVPFADAAAYRDALRDAGVDVSLLRAEDAGHDFWRTDAWRGRVNEGIVEFIETTI